MDVRPVWMVLIYVMSYWFAIALLNKVHRSLSTKFVIYEHLTINLTY